MKIEDAIRRYESWAEDDRIDILIRKEHRQMADWLKELKTDRPQGEWIEVDDSLISCKCSICGWESHMHEDDVYGMPYCPNCGACMKGADDEHTV